MAAFWDRRRPRYLFSGLMVCGDCGGGYSKISANLFGCSTARNKGSTVCTNRLNIRRDVLEESVLAGLRERLMEPALYKVFAEEFVAEANRLRKEDSGKTDEFRSEQANVERRIAKLVSAIADGLPARSVRDDVATAGGTSGRTGRLLIARAPEAPPPLLHPNQAQLYRSKVAQLHELLFRPDTQAEAMDLIRSLVEAIVLTPEDGQLRIDLRGELAGILALCADSKKPGSRFRGRASRASKVGCGGPQPPLFAPLGWLPATVPPAIADLSGRGALAHLHRLFLGACAPWFVDIAKWFLRRSTLFTSTW